MRLLESILAKTSQKYVIWSLVIALVIWNILMNTPGLPTSTPSMQAISPSFTPFDLQAGGYTVESFVSELTNLGQEGRAIYRNFMILDIAFPTIYGLTFASIIFLVFRRGNGGMKWICIVPILTALSDYVENTFIALAFYNYPSHESHLVAIASGATQFKMLLNVLLVGALLITLVFWVRNSWLKK